ncbi:MAG: hypothetical protein KDA22_12145 [Phycisphaerales bacterium]|nr:hypothetical protein [Phycisphaerales bacterium]
MDDPGLEDVDKAWRFLRRCYGGSLHFDEHIRPIDFVPAPDGQLVAPVMVAMLESVDVVLFVPDEEDGCMELMVSLEPLDESGPHGHLTDRWRIYHGDPPDVRWAFMSIDAARHEGLIIDGVGLMRPNPLAGIEAMVCREVNGQRRDVLRAATLRQREIELDEPCLVGVDPGGFDVRGAFGVHRVEATGTIADEHSALEALDQLATGCDPE